MARCASSSTICQRCPSARVEPHQRPGLGRRNQPGRRGSGGVDLPDWRTLHQSQERTGPWAVGSTFRSGRGERRAADGRNVHDHRPPPHSGRHEIFFEIARPLVGSPRPLQGAGRGPNRRHRQRSGKAGHDAAPGRGLAKGDRAGATGPADPPAGEKFNIDKRRTHLTLLEREARWWPMDHWAELAEDLRDFAAGLLKGQA